MSRVLQDVAAPTQLQKLTKGCEGAVLEHQEVIPRCDIVLQGETPQSWPEETTDAAHRGTHTADPTPVDIRDCRLATDRLDLEPRASRCPQVGSFYELYEDDAEHATRVLGWKMTLAGVGQCRQVGCPAGGLDQAMEALLAAGHKVGIIEQLETTQEAKAARGSLAVVRRELTSIVTPATHGASTAGNRPPGGLLCLSEGDAAPVELGLAMLDPARGTVLLGAETDASDSRACLRGVLARLQPREVLVCPDQLSKATRGVLADPSLGLQVSWIRGDVPRCVLGQPVSARGPKRALGRGSACKAQRQTRFVLSSQAVRPRARRQAERGAGGGPRLRREIAQPQGGVPPDRGEGRTLRPGEARGKDAVGPGDGADAGGDEPSGGAQRL